MYKLSDMVSKQVITLRGALSLGTVADVLFSPSLKKADSLLLLDDEENDERFLKLPVTKIARIGENAVVVGALSCPLESCPLPPNNPVHRLCFGVSGKALGALSDVETDEKFNVTAFTVGDKVFPFDKLVSMSETLAVFNDTGETVKIPKVGIRRPKAAKKTVVKVTAAPSTVAVTAPPVQNTTASVEVATAAEETVAERNDEDSKPRGQEDNAPVGEPTAPAGITTPTGAIAEREYDTYTVGTPTQVGEGTADFSFLLGSHLTRPLTGSSGRLIAPENAVVTREIIDAAAREGKLVQLALRAEK